MKFSERILVTGAKGLVGTAVTKYLLDQGYHCLIPIGRQDCDLTDPEATRRFFEASRPDHVFHAAARVYGIMGNIKNKALSFYDNVMINTNVIDAAQKAGVRKITVMGTVAAYPHSPSTGPLKEDAIFSGLPHHSEDSYAHAKRAMLAMLQAYQESYGLDWAYMVSCNLYGPNDKFDTRFGHVIPSLIKKFFHAAQNGGKVLVWGDGSARRDFMYVKDLARAALQVMQSVKGPVNVGAGKPYRIKELVEVLAEISGLGNHVVWDPDKPNGQQYKECDFSRLNSTGFKRAYSLHQGLQETWDWYAARALKERSDE